LLTILCAFAHNYGQQLLAMRACAGRIALGGMPAVAMAYLARKSKGTSLGLSMGLYISGSAFGGMSGRAGQLRCSAISLVALGPGRARRGRRAGGVGVLAQPAGVAAFRAGRRYGWRHTAVGMPSGCTCPMPACHGCLRWPSC
jgi:MFS family permease